jgi:hypothetical protein
MTIEQENIMLKFELEDLKKKYDLLCKQLKKKANDNRNDVDSGDHFLWNYGRERNGPWN